MPTPNRQKLSGRVTACGLLLIFILFFALLLGLGMPGVGWVMAVLALMGLNWVAMAGGIHYLTIGLIINVIHLLTIGPLAILGRPPAHWHLPPAWFTIVLVILPLCLSCRTIYIARKIRAKKNLPP